MSWENDDYTPNLPLESVASLAEVTPTGRLSTTNPRTGRTIELVPNVEAKILEFLSGKKPRVNILTPRKLLQKNALLRNIPVAANNMKTRRNQPNFEAFLAEQEELNRPRREAAAAAELARIRNAANRQAEAQYNEFIRNSNRRASPGYQEAIRKQQEKKARNDSRLRRGKAPNTGKPWPRNKSRKRKN
jgi:hypothetical protein